MPGDKLLEFCSLLPKVELHAHLNGSLSPETLLELQKMKLGMEGEDSSPLNLHTFETLSECFEVFRIAQSLTCTAKAVTLATVRVIEEFSKENVCYLELRSTLRSETNMTKDDYLQAIINGVLTCKEEVHNICVKIIVSLNRSHGKEEGLENVKIALKYQKLYPNLIVGVDLSGNPTAGVLADFIEPLELGRRNGLKLTIHCGEVANPDEIKAVLDFKPDRIGHATCIHEDYDGSEKLWTKLLEMKLPVELCLTSNVKCKTTPSYEAHHFKRFYQSKHPLSLATDDKGVFSTSLSQEYYLAGKHFNLSQHELWNLSYNSISYLFTTDEEKTDLRNLLNTWKEDNLK